MEREKMDKEKYYERQVDDLVKWVILTNMRIKRLEILQEMSNQETTIIEYQKLTEELAGLERFDG